MLRSNSYSVTNQVECGCGQQKRSSKEASFIKLLGCDDFSKQMKIPHDFAMILKGYVPHRFIVENAISKKCWRVEVEKDMDRTVYIREGWADFVEAHQLEVGNFLLFEYEEHSIFVVKIYDKNGCQKIALDAQGCKNNPLNIIEDEECEPKILRTSRPRQEQSKTLFKRIYGNGIYKKKHAIRSKPVRTARVSSSNKAFSIKIHKYMKHQFKQLFIPKAVSLAQNLLRKSEVIIEDSMANRWPVGLTHLTDGRVTLCRGWNAFLKGNEVTAGDSMDFEFVTDDLVKVRVTKASQVEQETEEANSQNVAPNMDCELDELDANNAIVNPAGTTSITKLKRGRERGSFECSSSSFSFLWGPSTLGAYMHVPKVVTEAQNLMNKDSVVLRDPDGKCWPVEVSSRRDGRVALARGWVDFWKSQNIKTGDSLDFEFVSEYVIQVKVNGGKPLKSLIKVDETIINTLSPTSNDETPTEAETFMGLLAHNELGIRDETIAALPKASGFS